MGRKGKARKAAGATAEKDEEEEDPAAQEAIQEVAALLEALRLDEAASRAAAALALASSCGASASRALARQRDEAEEASGFLAPKGAEGVSMEVPTGAAGAAETSPCGRGLYAARAFKMGDVLVRERPLLVAPRTLVAMGRQRAAADLDLPAIREAYSALTSAQRRLLQVFEGATGALPEGWADVSAEAEQLARFARVMTVNAHDYRAEPSKAALYILIARANHSCDPNCGLEAGPDGELYFYALKNIQPGEEVVYSYLGGHFALHTRAIRQGQLLRVKLFECRCARCLAAEPELQVPCGAAGCTGFLPLGSGEGPWRCPRCSAEERGGSDRLAAYRRMEPLLFQKAQALEAQWANPEKDAPKYINDWEALAKSCGKTLGARHPTYGRALFFAAMALNTGLAMGVAGVDAARHATGLRLIGLPLLDYLDECCPLGVRRAALEPFAQAVVLLARTSPSRAEGHGEDLVSELVARAGRDEMLLLPWLDDQHRGALRKIVGGLRAPPP